MAAADAGRLAKKGFDLDSSQGSAHTAMFFLPARRMNGVIS